MVLIFNKLSFNTIFYSYLFLSKTFYNETKNITYTILGAGHL